MKASNRERDRLTVDELKARHPDARTTVEDFACAYRMVGSDGELIDDSDSDRVQ